MIQDNNGFYVVLHNTQGSNNIQHEGNKNGDDGQNVRREDLDMIILEELRVKPILIELGSS